MGNVVMMMGVGIDIGGTKIETQIFDENWTMVEKSRVATPADYASLVAVIADQIRWAKSFGDGPIGIGAAGLVNPTNGLAVTANFCANGKPLPADIMAAAGIHVTYMNDCRALALSEAVFGAGLGHRVVVGVILGTGVGGGLCLDGKLMPSWRQYGGEFGHIAAPAPLVQQHSLPILKCGCGRMGCIETLIAGGGVSRLARALIGLEMTPVEMAARRMIDPAAAQVWDVWTSLVAEFFLTISQVCDPDVIILGGGLSKMTGLVPVVQAKLDAIQFDGFPSAKVTLAQAGDTSGARGAAFAAWQEACA